MLIGSPWWLRKHETHPGGMAWHWCGWEGERARGGWTGNRPLNARWLDAETSIDHYFPWDPLARRASLSDSRCYASPPPRAWRVRKNRHRPWVSLVLWHGRGHLSSIENTKAGPTTSAAEPVSLRPWLQKGHMELFLAGGEQKKTWAREKPVKGSDRETKAGNHGPGGRVGCISAHVESVAQLILARHSRHFWDY